MRKLLKGALRRVWRLSSGVRRRLIDKTNRHLIAQFEPWLARVDRAHAQNQLLVRDVELLGDSIIRELVRLQAHVDAIDQRLQAATSDLADAAESADTLQVMPRRRAA